MLFRFFRPNKDNVQIDHETVRIFWQASLPYKALMLRGLLYPLGLVFSGVIGPLCISKALAALMLPQGRPMQYFTMFAIASALGLTFNRIGHPAIVRFQAHVSRDIHKMALETLLKRSIGFHANNIGGKLVSDATDYPIAFARLHDAVVTSMGSLGIPLVIGSLVIFVESWQLGIYMVITTAIIVGLGVRDSHRMTLRKVERVKAHKNVTAHLADTVTNIQTAKTFSREESELDQHVTLGNRLLESRIADWTTMSTKGNNRLIILAVLQALLMYTIIYKVQHSPELLGVGIFIFSFTLMLSNRLFEVNMLIRNVEESLLQAMPMTQIILESPEIQDAPGAKPLVVRAGRIDLNNVSFAYPDGGQQSHIFSALSLSITPGEKVGLVGPSGGGKSTLTKLLLRFEDIAEGSIEIDAQNIAMVTQASLRANISYVPQEPLLFHRTIAENIAYGKPNATEADIIAAAKQAHAHEFITKLADAYDTIVGERGVKLSGGQRQRIAIARAILKDAPILILDEATSALDSESEVLIQEALWKLMEKRTTIVIAHRLSTIQKMDRIVVLKDGAISEEGKHTQLLRQHGLYAKLWKHQSGGFIES